MPRSGMCAIAKLVVAGLILSGCTGRAEPPTNTVASEPANFENNTAVTVIGTPFYAVFKLTGCILTVAIAAPGAALLELTNRPNKRQERAQLDAGVAHNCGGSYVLGHS